MIARRFVVPPHVDIRVRLPVWSDPNRIWRVVAVCSDSSMSVSDGPGGLCTWWDRVEFVDPDGERRLRLLLLKARIAERLAERRGKPPPGRVVVTPTWSQEVVDALRTLELDGWEGAKPESVGQVDGRSCWSSLRAIWRTFWAGYRHGWRHAHEQNRGRS